jgi:hypothetical protein
MWFANESERAGICGLQLRVKEQDMRFATGKVKEDKYIWFATERVENIGTFVLQQEDVFSVVSE